MVDDDDLDWSRLPAPWTGAEVVSLSAFQSSGAFHPYTCDQHGDRNLVARVEGWSCPVSDCAHSQDWAWAWTAHNAWRALMLPSPPTPPPLPVELPEDLRIPMSPHVG